MRRRAARCSRARWRQRFKLELPAAQLEIVLAAVRAAWPSCAAARGRAPRACRRGRRARAARGRGRAPVRCGGGRAEPRRALRPDRARVRNGGAAPAGLRIPGARRGRGSRPHAGRLQRAARAAAGARRAGRQRAVPRGARHGPGLAAADDRGHAAAPGRAAAERSLGGVRGGPRGGAPRGACPAPRTGGSSCARTRRSARSSCACPTPRRPSAEAAPSPPWRTRLSPGSPARPSGARCLTGGSRRTAGWPPAMASTAEWPTCSPVTRVPVREGVARPARRAGALRRGTRIVRAGVAVARSLAQADGAGADARGGGRRPPRCHELAGRSFPERLLTGSQQGCPCRPILAAR